MANNVLMGAGPAHPAFFAEVSDQHFRRIEALCGISLSAPLRAELIAIKQSHTVSAFFTARARSERDVREEIEGLGKAALRAVEQSLPLLNDYTSGTLLAFSGIPTAKLQTYMDLGREISEACEGAVRGLKFRTSGGISKNPPGSRSGGPPKHPNFEEFVWQLAAIFRHVGGHVSANYSPTLRIRWSPFVKFVWAMSLGLPPEIPRPSRRAIGDAVNRALRARKAAEKAQT